MYFLPINNCTTIQFVTFRTLTTSSGVKMMQFGAKLYKNIYISLIQGISCKQNFGFQQLNFTKKKSILYFYSQIIAYQYPHSILNNIEISPSAVIHNSGD